MKGQVRFRIGIQALNTSGGPARPRYVGYVATTTLESAGAFERNRAVRLRR